jgi:hypothetical protein
MIKLLNSYLCEEVRTLLPLYIVFMSLFVMVSNLQAQGLAFTPQELACFEKVDDPAFIAPVVEPRFKIYRGLRGCTNFQCLQSRARNSKKVLQVFIIDGLKPSSARSHFGNLGWAKSNVAVIPNTANHLTNALLIDRGIEWDETDAEPWRIERGLKNHDEFVAETLCLRQTRRCKRIRKNGGACEISTNEVQPVRG